MNIFVPCTNVQDITLFCLRDYEYKLSILGDGEEYYNYFKERWLDGKTLINVEQDIAFWPGALEALWNCPANWCGYGYSITGVPAHPNAWPPLGLVKFSENFIAETKNLWNEVESKDWRDMDSGIAKWVDNTNGGVLGFHEHSPGVVNFHPELVANIDHS
jgi:hypothetical protein